MKRKAAYLTAQTKIENVINEVNDPVIEQSILCTTLVTAILKRSDNWDVAMQKLEVSLSACRNSMENARKLFGDKAFKKNKK